MKSCHFGDEFDCSIEQLYHDTVHHVKTTTTPHTIPIVDQSKDCQVGVLKET